MKNGSRSSVPPALHDSFLLFKHQGKKNKLGISPSRRRFFCFVYGTLWFVPSFLGLKGEKGQGRLDARGISSQTYLLLSRSFRDNITIPKIVDLNIFNESKAVILLAKPGTRGNLKTTGDILGIIYFTSSSYVRNIFGRWGFGILSGDSSSDFSYNSEEVVLFVSVRRPYSATSSPSQLQMRRPAGDPQRGTN